MLHFAIFGMTLLWIMVGLTAVSLSLYGLMLASTRQHVRDRAVGPAPATGPFPALSLLKPIKGDEESLEDNLRSFFTQAYPGPLQIVFASTERDDSGMRLARRLAAQYPHVESRFVIADENFGLNPKVANLAAASSAAAHDLMFQSDANVRLTPDYLRNIVAEYIEKDASLLSSLVVGVDEDSYGAAMENLHLSSVIAPAICAALHVAGVPCVIGKAMLMRRSELECFGGFSAVRNVLAEDFLLGRMYHAAGRKLVLSSTVVCNVNRQMCAQRFVARHSRWLKMRAVINVPSFIADLMLNPTIFGIGVCVASGCSWAGVLFALCIASLKVIGDARLMQLTRGSALPLRYWVVAPVKDVLMAFIWMHCSVSRTVEWRGNRFSFGPGSELISRERVQSAGWAGRVWARLRSST